MPVLLKCIAKETRVGRGERVRSGTKHSSENLKRKTQYLKTSHELRVLLRDIRLCFTIKLTVEVIANQIKFYPANL